MVLPINNVEMFVQIPPISTTRPLNVLFAILVGLGIGHLCYGDFWGFVLDTLFGLLGYLTFKQIQLSTIAFFCFLCAFNAGIDLIASINLIYSVTKSTPDELFSLAHELNLKEWQLIAATCVVTMDAIVMFASLILSCKVYTEVRSNMYAQIGLLTQPFMAQAQNNQENQQPHIAFQPFQGRAHRMSEPNTLVSP